MKQPIEVKNIKDLIPKKGVWYNYYGTIFISAMRQPNSYIRRKSIIKDGKKDNELSEWHFNWQYHKIESIYGIEKYGKKSFERTIQVDDENHRIDSIVESLAIEFQHTLSVDIEEMNTRFIAHSRYGLIPYLVIDFTQYSLAEFQTSISVNFPNKIKNKFEKWSKCNYAKSNNLFVDLEDGMYRIVNSKEINSYIIEKDYFVNNLLKLEKELLDKFVALKLIIQQEKKERFFANELKKLKLEAEKRQVEKIKRDAYNVRIQSSNAFSKYKKCINSPIIKPFMATYDDVYFEYEYLSSYEGEFFKETHSYKSNDRCSVVEFIEFSSVSRKEVPTSTGYSTKKKKEHLYAEITLKKKNLIVAEFKWLKGKSPQLIDNNEMLLF